MCGIFIYGKCRVNIPYMDPMGMSIFCFESLYKDMKDPPKKKKEFVIQLFLAGFFWLDRQQWLLDLQQLCSLIALKK